ncbi:T9SS C-terminal target domain-containing protein [Polaribacter sp. WD7]|nr:T9SS C-terminal target domain-containing protein [Polaribacter sp. WD7]
MKNTIYILLCFFIKTSLSSQVSTLVSSSFPQSLDFHENELYYVDRFLGSINKVDVSINNPTSINLITGLDYPQSIALNGVYLFYALSDGIYKINVTEELPNPILIVNTSFQVRSLAIRENELYFPDTTNGNISKIDINTNNPSIENIISGLTSPIALEFKGKELYISHNHGTISKIDINSETSNIIDIISGLDSPYGMAITNNYIYIAEFSQSRISKININLNNPTIEVILEYPNVIGPEDLAINRSTLYIAESFGAKISKFDISTLNLLEQTSNKYIQIYPNPTKDFIFVKGLSQIKNFSIYNTIGQKVMSGVISNMEMIETKNLSNGVYFLKLDNETILKFVKNDF